MSRRPFLCVLVVLGSLVLASCLGWYASLHVRSPSQVVADAGPPSTTQLTVAVRRSPLRRTIVARGQIALGTHHKVVLPALGVLTGVDVVPGELVRAGDRIASVNDRPVVLLRGEIPLWRDLSQGDDGEDVARLQRALAEAGHPTAVALATEWTAVLPSWALICAPLIGMTTGLVAGLYPAVAAARMEPVEALRQG